MSRPRRERDPAPGVLADGHALGTRLLRQLFVGQCLVLALHLAWMPAWLAVLAVVVAGYRYHRLRRGLPRVGILLRLVAVALLLFALWLEYGSFASLEGVIGLMLGVYLLKLLETHSHRDARVVVLIGLVAITAAFLHDQGIPMAIGALLVLAWQLQSLVWLAGAGGARQAWRETAWLLALSAPLMALLFLTFPRLGPLWSLPQVQHASTGLTDSIAPGDIAALSRSDARVFRARFADTTPPRQGRYWRVYTLSHFDGERWSRVAPPELAAMRGRPEAAFVREGRRSPWQAVGGAPDVIAELLLEPDSRPWRPSLGTPLATDRRHRFLVDGTLEGVTALASRDLLRLASSGAPPVTAGPMGLDWYTLLPPAGNRRARALAERIWQASDGDPRRYLEDVLARFGEAPYRYTLSPPALRGEDRVDAFLFESRAGYCSHYASATAFLARAAGIPARIVAGFLGGERHPDGHVTVRDYDAHAWTEVWLDGAWRRLDPTAAVAPERIDQGPQAVSDAGETFLADSPFSPLRLRGLGWANRLRLDWERLEYHWQREVIGYQREARGRLMAQLQQGLQRIGTWLQEQLPGRGGVVLVLWGAGGTLGLVGLAVLAWWSWRRHRRKRDVPAQLADLQGWLARRGLGPVAGESPAAHFRRVAPHAGPAGAALRASAEYAEQLLYAPLSSEESRERRRRLAECTAEVRRRLRRHRPAGRS